MAGRGAEPRDTDLGSGRDNRASHVAGQGAKPGHPRGREPSALRHLLEEERQHERRERAPRLSLRLSVTGVIVVGLFAIMLVRLWSLQVLHTAQYKAALVTNQIRVVQTTPTRGLIVARGGQVLAGDQVLAVVTLERSAVTADPGIVARLAAVLKMSTASIRAAINDEQYSVYQPIPIAQNIPEAEVVYLEEHTSEFPGVHVGLSSQRVYPYGSTASHLLGYLGDITAPELREMAKKGYTGTSVVGQSGVEYSFQSVLRGTPGTERLSVDPAGSVVGLVRSTPAKPGDDVILALDLPLQQQLDTDLANQIHLLRSEGFPAPSGSAVILDPRNGQVLSMASYPSYNPNDFVGGLSEADYKALFSPTSGEPLLNRAIAGLYTPGSTFKINSATAALDDGLFPPNYLYDDTGRFVIPNCTSGCDYHNAGYEALGVIGWTQAIAASDDAFFYNIGVTFWDDYLTNHAYGPTPIQHMAALYGFGKLTGIDLPGEQAGQVDGPAITPDWNVADNLEMAFGQGATLITPLQLADAYAAFAEHGVRYVPQVAAGIVTPSGKVVKRFTPVVASHVPLPASTWNTMLPGFVGAVEEANPPGTAYYTFLGYPYAEMPIAGKTGTATTSNNHSAAPGALFVAFGPLSDPRYVVAVSIDKAGYGDTGAAPVAREIFEWLISHPLPPVHLAPPPAP
jgi:penicillin-binding protein 2